jgi:copper chaperone
MWRSERTEKTTYLVPGVHCGNCKAAVERQLEAVAGVESVDVDLESKRVTVTGKGLDDGALRDAIDEAGYEVAA